MTQSISVITGASRGIGKAIAEKLAEAGHDLVICAKNPDNLKALELSIVHKYGVKVYSFAADLSMKSETLAFGQYVKNLNIPVQILVNNAGIFLPGTILTEPDDALETMLNTNISSAYHISRAVVPLMKGDFKAHLFNICSIASIIAYPQSGSYSISKFGMLAMSKSLREELKNTNIRVTAILPGATLTDSWAGTDIPEDRFMTPKDIADILWSTWELSQNAVVEEILIRPLRGDI